MKDAGIFSQGPGPARASLLPVTPDKALGPPSRLWVDAQGRILDCCEQVRTLFGYRRDELRGRPVSRVLPELAGMALLCAGAANPRLAFRCRCATLFRAVRNDGSELSCILFVNLVNTPEVDALRFVVRPRPR